MKLIGGLLIFLFLNLLFLVWDFISGKAKLARRHDK